MLNCMTRIDLTSSLRWMVVALFGITMLSTRAADQTNGQHSELQIMAGIPPHGQMLVELAGDFLEVSVLLEKGSDPHHFYLSPSKRKTLAGIDLYFASSLEFEQQLIDSIFERSSTKVIELDKGLSKRVQSSNSMCDLQHHDHQHETHDHGGHHAHDDSDAVHQDDPHLWMSPVNMAKQVEVMADELIIQLPQHAEIIQNRKTKLIQQLEQIHRTIQLRLDPYHGHSLICFHPAWGYFLELYGLQQVSVETSRHQIKPDNLKELSEINRKNLIPLLLTQPQDPKKATRTVSERLNLRLLVIDPLSNDYFTTLDELSRAIAVSESFN